MTRSPTAFSVATSQVELVSDDTGAAEGSRRPLLPNILDSKNLTASLRGQHGLNAAEGTGRS
jgi:hypothetical protein